MINKRSRRFAATKLSLAVVVALAALGSTPASAFRIATGDSDAFLRWDTSVRYNVGWRLEDINPHFANAFGSDETQTRFDKGDLITNRIDVFTEADYTTTRANGEKIGARVSGALWYENAYPGTAHTSDQINAAFTGAAAVPSNYGPGGAYSSYAKRFITRGSGEILDAFVFGGFTLGNTNLNIKLGQHNVYWGEALFSTVDGIAAGQQAIDGIKGASTPGAETKELFMPINQISAQWSFSDEWSLLGQYQFDWKPFRVASSGTYFGSSDGGGNLFGADPTCAAVFPGGTCLKSLAAIIPSRNGGSYGLAARWSPNWLEGVVGLYYRKYDEKLPWSITQIDLTGAGGPANPNNLASRLVYARDTEMIGLSLQRNFGAYSTGFDASYRRNTALNSTTSGTVFLPLSQTPSYNAVEGARGDTYHLVGNVVWLLNKTPFYETGNIQLELAYQRLDEVTVNPLRHNSVDYACKGTALNKDNGCSTKDSWKFNLGFSPQWMDALPSTNLTMPISYSRGLRGNSPTTGGSYEGTYTWSIGLTANYKTLYEFGLIISDQHQDYKTAVATAGNGVPGQRIQAGGASGSTAGAANDKRWLSLRFKTGF